MYHHRLQNSPRPMMVILNIYSAICTGRFIISEKDKSGILSISDRIAARILANVLTSSLGVLFVEEARDELKLDICLPRFAWAPSSWIMFRCREQIYSHYPIRLKDVLSFFYVCLRSMSYVLGSSPIFFGVQFRTSPWVF